MKTPKHPLKPVFLTLLALAAVAAGVLLAKISAPDSATAHRVPFVGAPREVFAGKSSGLPPNIKPPKCTSSSGATFTCYSPALLKQAYNFPTDRGAPTGRGQTIVVVVAYGSSTIEADLARFGELFDVPPPPSFTIVGPNGSGDPSDPYVQRWRLETSLDVEWAHAMAPGAKIVLVVSPSDENTAMNAAEAAALASYPGAIVSHSFGSDESDDVPSNEALHQIFVQAKRLGDTLVAGTGDLGATNGGTQPTALYPASDPLVTAVGGTEGLPYPDGLLRGRGYGAEQVWNESELYGVAGGGAPSVLFPQPSWQRGTSEFRARTIPDVAYNAAFDGGVLVSQGGGIALVYGTSAGSPQWAAIFALVNEMRARSGNGPLGISNAALYTLSRDARTYRQDFHDITVGNNALDSYGGFNAQPGYDLATGLGTPNVGRLVEDLAKGSDGRNDGGENDGGPKRGNGERKNGNQPAREHQHRQPVR
jgi:subtilase family serine protease